MASVNLDRINAIFRQVMQTNTTIELANASLDSLDDRLDDDSENHFIWTRFEGIQIDSLQAAITNFILNTYQREICPNVNLGFLREDIEYQFHNLQYNCYDVLDFISQKIGDSTERLAYTQLLEAAKRAVTTRHHKVFDLATFITDHTIKSKEIVLKGTLPGEIDTETLRPFEIFSNLIILNSGLFNRKAPSLCQYSDITDHVKRSKLYPPCRVPNNSARKSIKSMYFFKSGRVDVEYYTTSGFLEVCKALCNEEPKIYFPKSNIKPEDIFDRPLGRIKRVVKKAEVSNGTCEEDQ